MTTEEQRSPDVGDRVKVLWGSGESDGEQVKITNPGLQATVRITRLPTGEKVDETMSMPWGSIRLA
jgi:hypothetical protein